MDLTDPEVLPYRKATKSASATEAKMSDNYTL